jgi:hypothetical protein
MSHRGNDVKTHYTLSNEAYELYKRWHDHKNQYHNSSYDDNVKGIIAKYQGYCLRFALIIQALSDGRYRVGLVMQEKYGKGNKINGVSLW